MLKKPIWIAIETTLFYYSGNSTTGQLWSFLKSVSFATDKSINTGFIRLCAKWNKLLDYYSNCYWFPINCFVFHWDILSKWAIQKVNLVLAKVWSPSLHKCKKNVAYKLERALKYKHNTQFPSAIGWRKKKYQLNIIIKQQFGFPMRNLNPEFNKIWSRAFWVIAILVFSPYAYVDFNGLISR